MPRKSTKSKIATIGIDIGKNTFHLTGLDASGAVAMQTKLTRSQLARRLANLEPCLIGMEACSGAHHIARMLEMLGHDARLVPAQYVKPFLKGHKNDYRDAEAIAEAVQRPTMRFVKIKTSEQLDLLALHNVRTRLVRQRTAVINQVRGFLIERGIAVQKGPAALRRVLPEILGSNDDILSPRLVRIIEDLCDDWRRLDDRIDQLTSEIECLARRDENCKRLMTVPGIGPTIASAIVSAVGDASGFASGRNFSAWLGLVPRQFSTGDRTILGRISKRGNTYIRTLLVQAAHIILIKRPMVARQGLMDWIEAASKRLHRNVLVVALANRLARIAWSVLVRGQTYQSRRYVHAG